MGLFLAFGFFMGFLINNEMVNLTEGFDSVLSLKLLEDFSNLFTIFDFCKQN